MRLEGKVAVVTGGIGRRIVERLVEASAEVVFSGRRAVLGAEIAAAALYLASDETGFVNGEDMVIDGGLIWGRRFSEVVAGGHAWKKRFD